MSRNYLKNKKKQKKNRKKVKLISNHNKNNPHSNNPRQKNRTKMKRPSSNRPVNRSHKRRRDSKLSVSRRTSPTLNKNSLNSMLKLQLTRVSIVVSLRTISLVSINKLAEDTSRNKRTLRRELKSRMSLRVNYIS